MEMVVVAVERGNNRNVVVVVEGKQVREMW